MDARSYDNNISFADQNALLPEGRPAIDLHRYIALFRRRLRLLLAIAAATFIAAIIVTFQLTPKFTATSELMLDNREEKVSNVQEVLSGLPADTAAVDTEVEVLRSRNIAEKVVKSLNLDNDPEFNRAIAPKTFLASIFANSAASTDSPSKVHDKVVDRVMSNFKAVRSGLTYVIRVSFTSKSASSAANIANAFSDCYLLEQLDAKFDATKRASDWLNSRLSGLKVQVEQAEAAVAQYKATHGLMGITSGAGATIAQQEISNIDAQVAQAKAQQAEAEANLATARQQLARGSAGDDLGASLNSPVINELRQQRAQVSGQVADMAGRLGPRHPDMLKAQRQLADIDIQIQAEIKRITSNLEAQAQVSRGRTTSLQSSLSASRGVLASNGAASVQLNDLQRNADSLSTLYQTYLDRFKQTSNQQGLQQSDARVVSRAKVPTKPSFPSVPLNIFFSTFLSVGVALAATFLVEALENGLYTSEDVERNLGVPYLGPVPTASSTINRNSADGKNSVHSPTRYVVDKPLSSFSEAFRNLKTSILYSKVGEPVKIVAITSALPGEGKTTTCVCLGRVTAMGGIHTVVVDCDLRRRSVNRLFSEEPTTGLLEVLSGSAALDECLILDEASGAFFLPLSKSEYTPRDVFASAAMDRLLEELRSKFDVVLLDTAPVLPVADTRVLAPKADVTVMLAQWRKTPRKAVQSSIQLLESTGAHVIGVGLTQMDMKEQARSGYGDAGYYYKSYSQYYS